MVQVFDEGDIIKDVIDHLLSQGVSLVVLDNGSTDGTFSICEKFLGKGVLRLEKVDTTSFQVENNLRILYDLALMEKPDWVIKNDADEFLETGVKDQKLVDTIKEAEKKGYNLIQFDRYDFFMTDNDPDEDSVQKRLRYYSYCGDFVYRAWKVFPGIRIGSAAGHYPIFPEHARYQIYPTKLVLRHYPFRTKQQTLKKINARKQGTGSSSEGKRPLGAHYRNLLKQDFSKKIDHKILSRYNHDNIWKKDVEYYPHIHTKPPKKEDVFTEDGRLKIRHKSQYELELELLDHFEKLWELKLRKKVHNIKRSLARKKKSE